MEGVSLNNKNDVNGNFSKLYNDSFSNYLTEKFNLFPV